MCMYYGFSFILANEIFLKQTCRYSSFSFQESEKLLLFSRIIKYYFNLNVCHVIFFHLLLDSKEYYDL